MSHIKHTFFTSDWHVGHANSLKFDDRPFRDLDHMHRVLINNYNASVKPGAICYFLGDAGLCREEVLADVIGQLNGTKILITGNHDRGYYSMYKAGFDAVMHNATIYLGQNRITMSHCPLRGVWRENTEGMRGANPGDNWHGEKKNFPYSVADEGQFHLHGHIHSPNHGKSVKILGKQFDVGVVANEFRPVSISQIESWITKYNQGFKT